MLTSSPRLSLSYYLNIWSTFLCYLWNLPMGGSISSVWFSLILAISNSKWTASMYGISCSKLLGVQPMLNGNSWLTTSFSARKKPFISKGSQHRVQHLKVANSNLDELKQTLQLQVIKMSNLHYLWLKWFQSLVQ